MQIRKIKCTECDWRGMSNDADYVTDPRPLPGREADVWTVCPQCRTPENMRVVCDEPGCWGEVSCGTPTPGGYRNTCSRHYRMIKERSSVDAGRQG